MNVDEAPLLGKVNITLTQISLTCAYVCLKE